MKKRKCYMAGSDVDRAQTIAMAVPTNPYFQVVHGKEMTSLVIMSEESLAAVKNAKISVFDQGPAE